VGGHYSHLLTPMPTDGAIIAKLVELSYDESGDVAFKMQNSVMNTLETFNEFAEPGAKIFLFVGLGFAVFASILLMNFIATSISYKKREIGILRAVGARSSDVFKIFFSEATIIALINFVLAALVSGAAVTVLNTVMRDAGLMITLLNFGVRQIVLMLGVSILVALLASFFPVYSIAKKKPVDAIKDR
jgi:ABC-type antimicrobial peptide transport system permease subunit